MALAGMRMRWQQCGHGLMDTSIPWDLWHDEGRGSGTVPTGSQPRASLGIHGMERKGGVAQCSGPPPCPGTDGKGSIPVLTYAGMPVPVEVVSGPAGAAVAAHTVLTAVLAWCGLAFIHVWGLG